MMDPVTLLLMVTAAQVATRLTEALTQRWILRWRAEVTRTVAELPPGAELTEHDPKGAGWHVRSRPANGRSQ